jgi:hypothetical protein
MSSQRELNAAWRQIAKHARMSADEVEDQEARAALLAIAADYEALIRARRPRRARYKEGSASILEAWNTPMTAKTRLSTRNQKA